jgi:hypothetical protein
LLDYFSEAKDPYSVRAYIEEHVTLQPTYPQRNGEFSERPQDHRVWVDYELPWVRRETADDALRHAMVFLAERCEGEI